MKYTLAQIRRIELDFKQGVNNEQKRINVYNGTITRVEILRPVFERTIHGNDYLVRFIDGNWQLTDWMEPQIFNRGVDVEWPIMGYGNSDLHIYVERLSSAVNERFNIDLLLWVRVDRELR